MRLEIIIATAALLGVSPALAQDEDVQALHTPRPTLATPAATARAATATEHRATVSSEGANDRRGTAASEGANDRRATPPASAATHATTAPH